jgi:hypothetical protein
LSVDDEVAEDVIERRSPPMSCHKTPLRVAARTVMGAGLFLLVACGGRWSTSGPAITISPAPGSSTAMTTTPAAATSTTSVLSTTTITSTTSTTVASSTTSALSTTTVDVATTNAEITANWEKFFLPTTPISDRVALLENGASLQQALEMRSTDPLQRQASAVVKAVDLTEPGRATVTYDVLLNGSVALPDAQGFAVFQDGVWKVGADSFCALISLGATGPIPGCS